MEKILVVCVGNICRSPLGERLLQAQLPERFTVTSAGIGAQNVAGGAADATATEVAAERGVSLEGHVSRQITPEIARAADLILVMEPGHKRELSKMIPEVSGKTMLFDQWTKGQGIADPHHRSRDFHVAVNAEVTEAAAAWAKRLAPNG